MSEEQGRPSASHSMLNSSGQQQLSINAAWRAQGCCRAIKAAGMRIAQKGRED